MPHCVRDVQRIHWVRDVCMTLCACDIVGWRFECVMQTSRTQWILWTSRTWHCGMAFWACDVLHVSWRLWSWKDSLRLWWLDDWLSSWYRGLTHWDCDVGMTLCDCGMAHWVRDVTWLVVRDIRMTLWDCGDLMTCWVRDIFGITQWVSDVRLTHWDRDVR